MLPTVSTRLRASDQRVFRRRRRICRPRESGDHRLWNMGPRFRGDDGTSYASKITGGRINQQGSIGEYHSECAA
jgi:hypothetical protein